MTEPPDLETRIRTLEAQVDALQAELCSLTADMHRDGMGSLAPPIQDPAPIAQPLQLEATTPKLSVKMRMSRLARAGLMALTTGIALLILYAIGRML